MRPGQRLAAARRDIGFTQQDLADYTGISVGTIRDIEQGRRRCRTVTRLVLEAAVLVPAGSFETLETVDR